MSSHRFRYLAPRCNVGLLDILHIEAAKRFGCRWFLSFDSASGCRAAAAALGRKLFPQLDEHDRESLKRLGG